MGQKNGETLSFHGNGMLYLNGNYKNDKQDGHWTAFKDDGSLNRSGTIKDGKLDGIWKIFDRWLCRKANT